MHGVNRSDYEKPWGVAAVQFPKPHCCLTIDASRPWFDQRADWLGPAHCSGGCVSGRPSEARAGRAAGGGGQAGNIHTTVIRWWLTGLMQTIWLLLDGTALTVAAVLLYRAPNAKRAAKAAPRRWFAGDWAVGMPAMALRLVCPFNLLQIWRGRFDRAAIPTPRNCLKWAVPRIGLVSAADLVGNFPVVLWSSSHLARQTRGTGGAHGKQRSWIVPTIFDLLYREYCRACLTAMRRQLSLWPGALPETDRDADHHDGADQGRGAEQPEEDAAPRTSTRELFAS